MLSSSSDKSGCEFLARPKGMWMCAAEDRFTALKPWRNNYVSHVG